MKQPEPPEDPAFVSYLADQIEAYLVDHPRAADTAEGIARWWLSRPDLAPGSVEEALAHLLQAGYVVCSASPEGQVLYRLRPAGDAS